MFNVKITESFYKEFKRLGHQHRSRIKKMKDKLKEEGLNAVKILTTFKHYILV